MVAFLALLRGLPWRGIGGLAAVLAVAAFGWRTSVWRDAYKLLPDVQAALEAEQACLEPSECQKRVAALTARHDEIAKEVAADYERELADIAARPVPVQPVRLCRPARPSHLPVPGPSAGTDGASPGGVVSVETSSDIGQRLFDLADDADRESLKLRYLQEFNRAVSAPP